ncbi:hypothetical protein PGQ11_007038 [Apiospora arundinis]|uniref:Uncharacterized protein n=1 Tax=Apiospora arundinis TaxID=335852 RepID=A0ABR2IUF1_9PEZI
MIWHNRLQATVLPWRETGKQYIISCIDALVSDNRVQIAIGRSNLLHQLYAVGLDSPHLRAYPLSTDNHAGLPHLLGLAHRSLDDASKAYLEGTLDPLRQACNSVPLELRDALATDEKTPGTISLLLGSISRFHFDVDASIVWADNYLKFFLGPVTSAKLDRVVRRLCTYAAKIHGRNVFVNYILEKVELPKSPGSPAHHLAQILDGGLEGDPTHNGLSPYKVAIEVALQTTLHMAKTSLLAQVVGRSLMLAADQLDPNNPSGSVYLGMGINSIVNMSQDLDHLATAIDPLLDGQHGSPVEYAFNKQ